MDLEKIRELLQIVADSGVAEVEIEQDDFKLVVRKNNPTITVQPSAPAYAPPPMYMPPYMPPMPPAAIAPAAAPVAPAAPALAPVAPVPAAPAPASEAPEAAPVVTGDEIKAPIVGTFYSAPAPDADPYVQVGDRVKTGDVLCIIEAMKLMNEIEAEVAGTIREIFVENGQPVEFDQPLFLIDPS